MIIYFVCLLFWILFSVCCVAVGEKTVKVEFFEFPFYYFFPGVQGSRGPGVQGSMGPGVQGSRGPEVHNTGPGVQGFRASGSRAGVQGCRKGSGVQGFRGLGVQGFRGLGGLGFRV